MTEISRPWVGRTSEGAAGDAGPYSAQDWQTTWSTGFGQNNANRGVLRGVDGDLAVTASSPADTNVNVAIGGAYVEGIWYYNGASKSVAIASNSSGAVRIDIVVLVADYTAQTVRIAVVQGTPGAGVPTLTQSVGVIWQIPLAYITLASGFTSIANSAITDMRNYANLPANVALDVTNSSGGTLESGAAVIWLAGGGAAINTTTTEGNRNVAGVIESRVASAAQGRIITQGIFAITCDESVAVGDMLELSTTAGQAQKRTKDGIFARVLTANTGAGTKALAYVNVLPMDGYYDSGWFAVTGSTTYTKAHGLGITPRRIELYHSAVASPGAGDELVRVTHVLNDTNFAYSQDCVGADATNVYAQSGASAATGETVYSVRRQSDTGYWRILAWA